MNDSPTRPRSAYVAAFAAGSGINVSACAREAFDRALPQVGIGTAETTCALVAIDLAVKVGAAGLDQDRDAPLLLLSGGRATLPPEPFPTHAPADLALALADLLRPRAWALLPFEMSDEHWYII